MPRATASRPTITCRIGNADEGFTTADVMEATIDLPATGQSSVAQVQLRRRPDGINFLQQVKVGLGYGGTTVPVFQGHIEDQGRKFFPSQPRLKAVGELALAQFATLTAEQAALVGRPATAYRYGRSSPAPALQGLDRDTAIIAHLLRTVAGCRGQLDLQGDATIPFGRLRPVELRPGARPAELIRQFDEVTGYVTADGRDRRLVRRRTNRLPAATPMWAYTQGVNLLDADRPQTLMTIANGAHVKGRPSLDADGVTESYQTEATALAPDPYGLVWDPPGFVIAEYQSDLIETTAIAQQVANRILADRKYLADRLDLTVPGNPFLVPTATISVQSSELGLYAPTPYWLEQVSHQVRPDRYETRLTAVGYPQGAVVSGPPDPIAAATFSWSATGGVTTLSADAAPSVDPGGDPAALEYAWDASAGSNRTVSGAQFRVDFSSAQLAASRPPSLLLAVRTPDGRTASATYDVVLANL